MDIITGHTIYELVRSFDPTTNNPIYPTTFTSKVFFNGVLDSGTTVNMVLSDSSDGIYSATWSASTFGTYQLHIGNDSVNVVYISELYKASSGPDVNVYVGL